MTVTFSVIWFLIAGSYYLTAVSAGGGWISLLTGLITIFVPMVLIWVASVSLQSLQQLRAEARNLRETLDALRNNQSPEPAAPRAPALTPRTSPLPAAEAAPMTFHRSANLRPAPAPQPAPAAPSPPTATTPVLPEEQPALALASPSDQVAEPVSTADVIRALNFPDDPEDTDGIRALRKALASRSVAKLIRAAQDVLTLLSQDGIFMDDLVPDRARPEQWRKFAQGERGRVVAALGGIRDRTSLTLTAARMRQDTIFRDAAHHFLRQFDRSFSEFEPAASDQEIAALTDTRTARAFMLLGRVTGIFD